MIDLNNTPGVLSHLIEITERETESFKANGHVLIENLLPAQEVQAYRSIIVGAAEKYSTEVRKLEDRDTYGKAFLQVMNLWMIDEQVKKFTLARRFAKVAADLLGVENVRIYHDQALLKEPGGGPTPWHQDQFYWPVDTHKTITMWMPLIDIDEEMGMLTFASGSHTKGNIFNTEISDDSNEAFEAYVAENRFPISRSKYMKAGDASWHYGHTIHSAPGNASNIMRPVMTIIYVADGAKITEPINEWQVNDLKTWMGDMPVGSLVSSALNPLVL